jgi:hypothetical protein
MTYTQYLLDSGIGTKREIKPETPPERRSRRAYLPDWLLDEDIKEWKAVRSRVHTDSRASMGNGHSKAWAMGTKKPYLIAIYNDLDFFSRFCPDAKPSWDINKLTKIKIQYLLVLLGKYLRMNYLEQYGANGYEFEFRKRYDDKLGMEAVRFLSRTGFGKKSYHPIKGTNYGHKEHRDLPVMTARRTYWKNRLMKEILSPCFLPAKNDKGVLENSSSYTQTYYLASDIEDWATHRFREFNVDCGHYHEALRF